MLFASSETWLAFQVAQLSDLATADWLRKLNQPSSREWLRGQFPFPSTVFTKRPPINLLFFSTRPTARLTHSSLRSELVAKGPAT